MAQSHSALLKLPAELRNQVYEYVFTELNNILRLTCDPFNQLKFVCRELKLETEWLELCYNKSITMIRENAEHPKPAQQFINFAKNVSPQALECLSTVILENDFDDVPVPIVYLPYGAGPLNNPTKYIPHVSESLSVLAKLA